MTKKQNREAQATAHLARSLNEIKTSAQFLAKTIGPESRGYFTPDEEELALALLVSYSQVRNALFDIILEYRSQQPTNTTENPVAFLIPFACALLLIDAARFLREICDGRPVVRHKLNQPAPEFDIATGTFDRVQRSLVRRRHAWQVFRAMRFFLANEAKLRAAAESQEQHELLQTIDDHRYLLDVTPKQFFGLRTRTRGRQLLATITHQTLARATLGLQTLAGNLMADKYVRPTHKPQVPGPIAKQLCDMMRPGDVLAVRKEFALTNYFLPGYWPHVALYMGTSAQLDKLGIRTHKSGEKRSNKLVQPGQLVLEAMKDGVHIRSIDSPLKSDSLVLLRTNLATEHLATALARGLVHEGKPYDFDFNFLRSDRLVCTEVVYRSFQGVANLQIPLTKRAGRQTLSGEDLIQMAVRRQHFAPVAVYAPRIDKHLISDASECDRILTHT